MIALNTNCVWVRFPNGETASFFPEEVTPGLMGWQGREVDMDLFECAVQAVFSYLNQGETIPTVSLEAFRSLISAAFVSDCGKLVRRVRLTELLSPEDCALGELELYGRLRELLRELKGARVDLICVEGLQSCAKLCLRYRRRGKTSKQFANDIGVFIDQFVRANSYCQDVLILNS